MKKFIIIFGLMLGLLSIGFLGAGVSADRSIYPGVCGPDDNDWFPNGMFCGSSPDINPSQATFIATSPTARTGSSVRFHGGYNPQGPAPSIRNGGSNITLSNGSKPQGQVLVWVWIDGPAQLVDDLSITNINGPAGTSGNASLKCPGRSATGPGVVYNYRDTTGSYSDGAAQGVNNGDNASPSAYNPTNNSGLTDCGISGRMVYWANATDDVDAYSFDVKINNGRTGRFCVRMNVSVGFGSDVKYFPDANPSPSPHQQNVVASHVARQSDEVCTTVTPNPPVTGVSGTCSNLSFGADAQHSGVSTYTYIAISKIRNVSAPTPNGGNDMQQVDAPQLYTGRVLGDGKVHNISYLPTDRNLSVNLVRHYHKDYDTLSASYLNSIGNITKGAYDGDATKWPTYSYPTDAPFQNATIPCFSATCNITTWGDGMPGNFVLAGGTLHVQITITNTGPQSLPNPLSGPYYLGVIANGTNYQLDSTGYPGLAPPGPGSPQSGEIYFDIPNVTAATTVTAQPVYLGHFGLGGLCPGSGTPITVYYPFHLTPHASVCTVSSCSEENPTGIDFKNYIECSLTCPVKDVPNDNKAIYTAYGSAPSAPDGSSNTAKTVQLGSPAGNTTLTGTFFAGPTRPINAGDAFCSRITLTSYTDGYTDSAGNVLASPRWTDATRTDPSTGYAFDEGCLDVVNEPYVRAYTSGVSAGGNFEGTGCANPAGKGNLAAWSHTPTYFGSGADYSAFALGGITGFISGYNKSLAPPSGTTNDSLPLSFANVGVPITSSVDSPKLGGNFGGNHCIKKLKQPAANPVPTASPGIVRPLSSIPSGKYTSNVDMEIRNGNIPTLKNIELHVNGDVYISNSITYSGGGTPGNATSFTLRVTGNIYIDPSVRELDGYYIAEGNGSTTGKIYTCADDVGPTRFAPMAPANMFDRCTEQLTIYGAFAANQVNLMRTYGSLRNSPNPTAGCTHYGSGPSSGPTCAAEVFRFTPELYLAAPPDGPTKSWGTFDQITNLPPVL